MWCWIYTLFRFVAFSLKLHFTFIAYAAIRYSSRVGYGITSFDRKFNYPFIHYLSQVYWLINEWKYVLYNFRCTFDGSLKSQRYLYLRSKKRYTDVTLNVFLYPTIVDLIVWLIYNKFGFWHFLIFYTIHLNLCSEISFWFGSCLIKFVVYILKFAYFSG